MAGTIDPKQDRNQNFSVFGISGTLGDSYGTAEPRPLTVTETGAINIDVIEPTSFNGGTVSIGTAPVELTFTGTPQSIMITADHGNGTIIYIGGSLVAQSGSAAFVSLYPGESLSLDYNNGLALYAVAGTTSQKIYKVALT